MSVASNLARIQETLGSRPVTLIAVTKNVGPAGIVEAFESGVTEFGENRIQDALIKHKVIAPAVANNIHWHFIGHLQTNKVRKVVGRFVLIHSVDSLRLAKAISEEAVRIDLTQPILIQVNIACDPNKHGFSPEQLREEFAEVIKLPKLQIKGLMTIAPLTSSSLIRRQCFTELRILRDELAQTYGIPLRELSMGMSADWQEAVSAGSTMIRVGQAIFGSPADLS